MIDSLFFVLILFLNLVQGSQFNFDFINEELGKEMVTMKTHFPTILCSPLPTKPFGEPLKHLLNPDLIHLAKNGIVFEDIPRASSSIPTTESSVNTHMNIWLRTYINQEIKAYRPKSAVDADLIGMMITFIFGNYYSRFIANQKQFQREFKCEFEKLTKGDGINFFAHYIISFGATSFFHKLNSIEKLDFERSEILIAFLNLIKTKPLSTLVECLKNIPHDIPEDAQKEISKAVQVNHPHLNFFDYLLFELKKSDGCFNDALKIFETKNGIEKMNLVKDFLNNNLNIPNEKLKHFSYRRLLVIPISSYTNFFDSIDIESKFFLAKIAIIHGAHGALIRTIELCPEIALMAVDGVSLFDIVVMERRIRFIPLMVSIIPEYLTVRKSEGTLSLYESLIKSSDLEMVKALEDSGFSSESKILNGLNAVQYAFKNDCHNLLSYFREKLGKKQFRSYLVEICGSEAEFKKIINEKYNSLCEKLRVDSNNK